MTKFTSSTQHIYHFNTYAMLKGYQEFGFFPPPQKNTVKAKCSLSKIITLCWELSRWLSCKEPACNAGLTGLTLSREDSLEKEMVTHCSTLAGRSHGERSLMGYSPWGRKSRTRLSD